MTKPFRFRLQRVLEWRRSELELEESRLQRLHAALAAIDHQRAGLESARQAAARALVTRAAADGADLRSLAEYGEAAHLRLARLAEKRRAAEAEIARQQQKLLEARRRCRLLEKLRERRLAEWQYEAGREEDRPWRVPRRDVH